jgi:glucose-6-phosphate 1-epimerase
MPPTHATAAQLASQFGIADIAQVFSDAGGLPAVRLKTPRCSGEVHLHGAQVTSWKPTGADEVIFVSSQARWADGQAIRGGIPICFPWFRGKSDNPLAPAHGFARTRTWELQSIENHGGDIMVTMATESDDRSREWWPAEFRLVHRVTFGRQLKLELTATNSGASALRFEEALHTYYFVGDVATARIRGLHGVRYLDNHDGNREKTQNGDVAIHSPTDRAYLATGNALELSDPVLKRRIKITKQNSRTTVLWNPWESAANKMSDMGRDEWKSMLCAEAANILTDTLTLGPGQPHTMAVTMTVYPL